MGSRAFDAPFFILFFFLVFQVVGLPKNAREGITFIVLLTYFRGNLLPVSKGAGRSSLMKSKGG